MSTSPRDEEALGLIETSSLPAMIAACDAAVKASTVRIVALERIGCTLVTCFIRGDVASVRAAVEAGSHAAASANSLVGSHVIPRPHVALAGVFPISEPRPVSQRGVDIDCGC